MSEISENHISKTICLCMIVCNESHIIARALRSVSDLIDYWVICDTGSSDGTEMVIMETMAGIPGELHKVSWVNFGFNRGEVIRLAKDKADYFLILDADMVANVHAPFRHKLTRDYYEIRYEGDVDYSQPMLVSNGHDWKYKGVTHEYIYAESATSWEVLNELTLTHLEDGGMRADKFERDVKLLSDALQKDPENIRDIFYLAQSYKDLGKYEEAICWYEKRIQYEGWIEEKWFAMFQLACVKQLSGHPWNEVLLAYLAAYSFRPARVEPLYEIVRYYRETENFHLGYLYAAGIGNSFSYPEDLLFIYKPVYKYLFRLEYGVCAYGSGKFSEAVTAFNEVLKWESLPEWVEDSAMRGRILALDRIYKKQMDPATRNNRIKVIVPYRNAGNFLEKCIETLLNQQYSDFEIILIDDASDDGATDALPADPGVRLLRQHFRKGAAFNLYSAITRFCDPEDIVVCVDGDDWLEGEDVLDHINQVYNTYDCWVMYGQFRYSDGSRGFSQPFASETEFKTLRDEWRTSHIRTFRAGLFLSIASQDPEYSCLKDNEGNWLTSATDAAIMFPLLEMAGFGKVIYNDKILYVYNIENPESIFRKSPEKQIADYELVKIKRPFARIHDYCKNMIYKEVITGNCI
jgi:glycosyltransferase involved in cell wall biosynthesis